MADKAGKRRSDLRARLIDIAEARIEQDGMQAIKARDLAREAGCAVGAIYNVFDDLHDIIIAVNGRTFHRIGQAVAQSLKDMGAAPPTERLIAMSHAYLAFAAGHPRIWRSLFDIRMSTDMDIPDWYMDELEHLFGFIAGPVSECFPDLPEEEVALMTRALFSSVHGIVLLGLEKRISGVPAEALERMISMLLQQTTGNR